MLRAKCSLLVSHHPARRRTSACAAPNPAAPFQTAAPNEFSSATGAAAGAAAAGAASGRPARAALPARRALPSCGGTIGGWAALLLRRLPSACGRGVLDGYLHKCRMLEAKTDPARPSLAFQLRHDGTAATLWLQLGARRLASVARSNSKKLDTTNAQNSSPGRGGARGRRPHQSIRWAAFFGTAAAGVGSSAAA